jgi:hypothetical protein
MSREFLVWSLQRDTLIFSPQKASTKLIEENPQHQTKTQELKACLSNIGSRSGMSHFLPSTNRMVLKSMLSPFPLAMVGATTANNMPRPVAVDVNHVT